MTLLEMIKKYEEVKSRIDEDDMISTVVLADNILTDLKNLEERQPSWVDIRNKVMKRIDIEIKYEHYSDALILAQTLPIFPR